MKKIFALILALTFVGGIPACSHQPNDAPNPNPSDTIERIEEPEGYLPGDVVPGVDLSEPAELPRPTHPTLNMATLRDWVELRGEELTRDDLGPYYYNGEEVASGLYVLRYPTDTSFYLLIGGNNVDETPVYIRLVSVADPDYYIDVRYDDIDKFISCGVTIPSFSYKEDAAQYKDGDPGVNPHTFANMSRYPVDSQDTALERAERECTVKYVITKVSLDSTENMWKVEFYNNHPGGGQIVYLDSNGITRLVVYGE